MDWMHFEPLLALVFMDIDITDSISLMSFVLFRWQEEERLRKLRQQEAQFDWQVSSSDVLRASKGLFIY